ncbi:hypothetical protein [uncultured Paraglaciecola sp.]|uniref:hypothetical protein n=1 Tax=uncultured Paraglaciecola sp. TaxID=1765024 RepID=UPI002636A786|nr:hypothetical protein [uncultured Paraglaciecola sp.]
MADDKQDDKPVDNTDEAGALEKPTSGAAEEQKPTGETDTPKADESSEENEIVLAGQEGSPPSTANKPSSDGQHSNTDAVIKRMRRKRERLDAENETLRRENEQLRRHAQGGGNTQGDRRTLQLPNRPTRAESGYDEEKFDAAMAEWTDKVTDIKVQAGLQQANQGQRVVAAQQREQTALKQYAENANALKVPDFNDTQEDALDVLGADFGTMLARELPSDAPKLVYFFGKNPEEAVRYREMFDNNPGGTTFELGKLAERLVIKRKQSSAAAPEDRIDGQGLAGGDDSLEGQLAKIDEKLEKGEMEPAFAIRETRRIKRELREKQAAS